LILDSKAEEETMAQSFDAEKFLQASADAIIAAGADGKIILWNPAATRLFGFAANEALGQSLDLIIPERFRARHWEGYKQVMATGSTKYGAQVLRVPAQHRDGKALSIAFTVSLLDAPDRKEKLIVAIVRDETARWSEERELRRRLTELERQAK
jgi:PAS domain S-box-containing protein